jgi:Sec-independent protein translocase protein TatA
MSIAELLIIFLVALLVIKPERLPEIAYTLGRFLRSIRRWYQDIAEKSNSVL